MKIFKFMAIALVAMFGFTACDNECEHELNKACEHEYIEVDYSNKLAGTWTSIDAENEFAEALIFSADGTVTSTGVFEGGYWEKKGTFNIKDNKMTLSFEDGDCMESRFEMVEGKVFSLVDDELDVHFNYYYCENDLTEEIVGMWVSTQEAFGQEEESITINTFNENGKAYVTAFVPEIDGYVNQAESDYKVIGNMLITWVKDDSNLPVLYTAIDIDIIPDGTELGDIMTTYNPVYGTKVTFLRVKQSLELPGNKYDYSATYITNAKGEDKDIPFLNTSFNFAKMDGSIIDKFLKSTLFSIEFPDANTLKYSFLVDGENTSMSAPIEVDGNKMTVKMSVKDPVYQDVVIYTFQDQDNTQMHLYMPTESFEKFFANTSVTVMLGHGQLDKNDTEAVAAVYKNVADAVESINLSIVTKAAK
ncbi:MAG: hypothetical protein J6Q48_08145 [Bacteroidaceae bacterium]|nr:hypothetical protein [Bacteroidaceae bacterium]